MNKRIDIMTDIETLGVGTDALIIQVSAIAFDIYTGEEIGRFDECVNINCMDKSELNIEPETLQWWIRTDAELLSDIMERGKEDGYGLEETLQEFKDWIDRRGSDEYNTNIYLWGNSPMFDNAKLQRQMENYGIEYPIFYRNDRCQRTILELTSLKLNRTIKEIQKLFEDESLTKHDALDDCIYQIRLVSWCFNQLIGSNKNG